MRYLAVFALFLWAQTASDLCGRCAQLGSAVTLHADCKARDDDLAAFETESDFASGRHTSSDSDVLGDRDPTFFRDAHGWQVRQGKKPLGRKDACA